MFKVANLENELFSSMKKQIVSNQVENKFRFNKLAKAVEYLSAAAEIFDNAGMSEEAEELTKVLHGLAEQLSGKTL
jgi:hypothetical protein